MRLAWASALCAVVVLGCETQSKPATRGNWGDPCEDRDGVCNRGLTCFAGVCSRRGRAGERCLAGNGGDYRRCVYGLVCDRGGCRTRAEIAVMGADDDGNDWDDWDDGDLEFLEPALPEAPERSESVETSAAPGE